MPDSADSLYASLSVEAHQRINAICRRFEQAWKEGGSPRIEEHLGDCQGNERKCLMRRLLQVELYQFRQALPSSDEYLARFPEFRDTIVSVFAPLVGGKDKAGSAEEHDEEEEQGDRPANSDRDTVEEFSVTVSVSPSSTEADEALVQEAAQRARRRRKKKLPESIGGYKIMDYLGGGGFGDVYKAFDQVLKATVAIKIPREGAFESERDEERFFREARSAADLHHPNIVHVKSVGEDNGMPYIVCEYIQGMNLSHFVASKRPNAQQSAVIAAQVADALHHAHEHNVIHRDVKPSNILIDDEGRPHLADFGLAHYDAETTSLTQTGQILGTLRYISPEQASGDARSIDRRSDIYSLGVVMYQMLTGSVPFQGSAVHIHHQILFEEPTPPRQVNRHVPRDLETICLKCMDKNPKARYATAHELAEDLRRFLRDEPILARRSGPVGRLARWCVRNRVFVGLIAVVFVLVGVLSFVTYSWIQAERAKQALIDRLRGDVKRFEQKQPEDVLDLGLEDLFGADVEVADKLAEEADKVPRLQQDLRSSVAEARVQAATALGLLGELAKDAIPALVNATRDNDSRVRAAAAEALKKIRSKLQLSSNDR